MDSEVSSFLSSALAGGLMEDKLVVDGKMYVYSEEQGRVVQHRREPGPRAGSRWTSLESIETGSVTIRIPGI